ncbi:MAG: AI-2E family transporter [Clostridia bacterium]|nr:AI-2E family transporter [Clostridia bacterium]
MNEVKRHWTKWLYWFVFAVAVIAVYKTLDSFGEILDFIKKFLEILAPFLAGTLIAYLFYIPSRNIEGWIRKCKVNIITNKARGLSIFVVYVIALILIIITVNVILPVILNSVMDLTSNLQGYYTKAVEKLNTLPENSPLRGDVLTGAVDSLRNIDLTQYINASDITNYAKGILSVANSIFNIFVALVVSIYILAERKEILIFIKKVSAAMFNQKISRNLGKYFNSTNQIFFRFLASQLLDAIVVGILITIGFSIMGIKYAPLLGFIIGLFNMIPYFGSIIAIAISSLITLISGGLSQMIWMIIVSVVIQQVDANIINPKILGNSLKVSPLIIIAAVTIGGAYFGVVGMFLAVPVAAALKIVIMDYIDYRLRQKKAKKETV